MTPAGHLVVSHVPYVNDQGQPALGQLACSLNLAGDVAAYNGDHVVSFIGGVPCDRQGQPLSRIINNANPGTELEQDMKVAAVLSSKPDGNYHDYHHKMTSYIAMISPHAAAINPELSAITHPAVEDDDPEGPFEYLDSASSRAGISIITDKLRLAKVVIVGLGGTGSYVLDLVSKTPVGSIHLYDGDNLYSHNAFRAPGAVPIETLRDRPKKVHHFANLYSKLKRGIVPHPEHVTAQNVGELRDADFVFLTMEGNQTKRLIVEHLTTFGVPFVDVGIGLNVHQNQLYGAVQTISRTPATGRAAERNAIAFDAADDDDDLYDMNIQVADLNALNATLAVIRWKKYCGFYVDTEDEHYCSYNIDSNQLMNDDLP